jgi:ribosomal protein S12 methylthiotransferase accessory factor
VTYAGLEDYLNFTNQYPFAKLILPHGGLTNAITPVGGVDLAGTPFHVMGATLGAPEMAFPRISPHAGKSRDVMSLGGGGADEDVDTARVRALAEALERYATCVLRDDEYIVATQQELGSAALDLTRLPRCSKAEYSRDMQYYRPADPKAPIRWLSGLSLTTGEKRYIPVVMTHLYGRAWEGERFWPQITTGVAAHTDPVKALVSAICEVIERDAISLTWLMRLPLPRLHFDEDPPARHARKFAAVNSGPVKSHFFDATTDLGVPTVYLVQTADNHPHIAQFVNCATDISAWDAAAKLIREAAAGRTYMAADADNVSFPDDLWQFVELKHGAGYMGRPEQRSEFDFLLKGRTIAPISGLAVDGLDTPRQQLDFLLARLKALDFEVFGVDLTTDELRDCGLYVFRALIPDLVPMSPVYAARFLDHPRLYRYPLAAGFGARTLEDVNPAPQPFA